jgi:hypothetical protein
MSLQLIDGKFYRNGKVEPIEFGNTEQIKLMNEVKQQFEDLAGDGLVVDPDDIEIQVKATIKVKCSCGQTIYFEEEAEDESMIDFEGQEHTCRRCRKEYKASMNEDDNWVVKLIK